MKLTRRTFLKFLGLAVVPVAALAKLPKPAKEKPFPEGWTVTEEESEHFIDPEMIEKITEQLSEQSVRPINRYISDGRIANKALARYNTNKPVLKTIRDTIQIMKPKA